MKLINRRKTIISFLLIIELFMIFVIHNSFKNKNVLLDDHNYNKESMFALYLESQASGKYEEYNDNFPIDGYVLNESMTYCFDNEKNNINDVYLSFENGIIKLKSNKTVFCNLYFDIAENEEIDTSGILADIFNCECVGDNCYSYISKYNGEGNINDTAHPFFSKNICYWNGTTSSNVNDALNKRNVVFADTCWQMIRTTDTGGVKLLYNGKPNVSVDSETGKTKYDCSNSRSNHNAGIGTRENISLANNYYYGAGYIYNRNTQKFTLTNVDSNAVTMSTDNYEDLIGKYTCKSSNAFTECSTLYYVDEYISGSNAYTISIVNVDYKDNLGVSTFNNAENSLAYVGYMYNEVSQYTSKIIKSMLKLGDYKTNETISQQTITVGTGITYNSSSKTYTIKNTNQYNSTDNLASDKTTKYYMCADMTSTNCSYKNARLIVNMGDGKYNYYSVATTGGGVYTVSNSIVSKSTALNNANTIIALDWYIDYESYNNYYLCPTGEVDCSNNLNYIIKTYNNRIDRYIGKYNFSNEISYNSSKGEYNLGNNIINPIENPETFLNDINSYYYFCLNDKNEFVANVKSCKHIGYVFYVNSSTSSIGYAILTNGKYINTDVNNTSGLTRFASDDNIIYAMLYSDNVNNINSIIKDKIDWWYKSNLYHTIYENLIDTKEIYCNDRRIIDYGSWSTNRTAMSTYLRFISNNLSNNINCPVKTDAFSTDETTYGNGKLSYPIGLLSASELYILKSDDLRASSYSSWLGTPIDLNNMSKQLFIYSLNAGGGFYNSLVDNSYGIRPAISLKSETTYNGGDGSPTNPFIIEVQ